MTLQILWKAVGSAFSYETASEWHVKCSLITPFPITNSKWVTLHILQKALSSHFILWWAASEQHCTFCERQLITSFPMTNSKRVTLHILWMAVSSHHLLLLTACEWHHLMNGTNHIVLYNQQLVSHIAHFVTGSLIFSYDWQLVCNITHLWKAHHTFSYHQQRVCDIVLWKAVSSHLSFLPTASEPWHCAFCER